MWEKWAILSIGLAAVALAAILTATSYYPASVGIATAGGYGLGLFRVICHEEKRNHQ